MLEIRQRFNRRKTNLKIMHTFLCMNTPHKTSTNIGLLVNWSRSFFFFFCRKSNKRNFKIFYQEQLHWLLLGEPVTWFFAKTNASCMSWTPLFPPLQKIPSPSSKVCTNGVRWRHNQFLQQWRLRYKWQDICCKRINSAWKGKTSIYSYLIAKRAI